MAPTDLAVALEQRGFDSLWVAEHLHMPVTRRFTHPLGEAAQTKEYFDVMDRFVTLSAAAAGPISAIGGLLCDGVQRSQSNAVWASFDDTEGRWVSRERHVEGGYRLGETFQCQAAEVFDCDYFLYGSGDATGDQDLPILRLSTEPSGQVAHGADCGIAGALGKADLAKRRVALGDAGAKTQLTIAAAPVGD